jgi:hypothetical protein
MVLKTAPVYVRTVCLRVQLSQVPMKYLDFRIALMEALCSIISLNMSCIMCESLQLE